MGDVTRWLLALWLAVSFQPALAQFDKSAWPTHTPTPLLEALDMQGKVWSKADLLGHTVVLNFWATWCAPCKEELPTLQTLHDISDSSTLVLSVNVREPALRVARYVQATGLTFPVMLDSKGELAKRWGVTVYPTTILIAHRYSMLRDAGHVIVLDRGHVVEEGAPDELIARGGWFAQLAHRSEDAGAVPASA